jgi:hypothetical protein
VAIWSALVEMVTGVVAKLAVARELDIVVQLDWFDLTSLQLPIHDVSR